MFAFVHVCARLLAFACVFASAFACVCRRLSAFVCVCLRLLAFAYAPLCCAPLCVTLIFAHSQLFVAVQGRIGHFLQVFGLATLICVFSKILGVDLTIFVCGETLIWICSLLLFWSLLVFFPAVCLLRLSVSISSFLLGSLSLSIHPPGQVFVFLLIRIPTQSLSLNLSRSFSSLLFLSHSSLHHTASLPPSLPAFLPVLNFSGLVSRLHSHSHALMLFLCLSLHISLTSRLLLTSLLPLSLSLSRSLSYPLLPSLYSLSSSLVLPPSFVSYLILIFIFSFSLSTPGAKMRLALNKPTAGLTRAGVHQNKQESLSFDFSTSKSRKNSFFNNQTAPEPRRV